MTGLRIEERIASRHPELTAQERRAAATLLEHLDDLATYRAAELAALAGVSKATMSRLFRSLGFADFGEVRDHLRALRSGEPRRPPGAAEGPPDLAAHAEHETGAVSRTVLQPGIGEAVALVADATRVLVVGWRNSYPVALHLREQLVQARPRVGLAPLPGQVLGEELVDLGPGDVLVAVGFRRRPSGFAAFLTAAASTGADVVLLGDPTAAACSGCARVWLPCPVQGPLAYDSYAAAMSLVAVLADGVLARIGAPGRDRVSSISATYTQLAEVE